MVIWRLAFGVMIDHRSAHPADAGGPARSDARHLDHLLRPDHDDRAVHPLGRWSSRSFPTVLLIATMMRLALNLASTRLILTDGHDRTLPLPAA